MNGKESAPTQLLRAAYANMLSDVVMSLIALGVVGSACLRWANGHEVQDSHAISVGVIVAYFFARNHLTALNELRREGTAREVTQEIATATTQTPAWRRDD